MLEQAWAMKGALVREQPDNPLYRYTLAHSCRSLAASRSRAGRLADARALLEEGVAIAGRLTADSPGNPDYLEVAAATATDLAMLESREGRDGEAPRLLRSALARLDRIAEPGPQSQYLRARVLVRLGLVDAALACLRQAALAGYRDRAEVADDPALDPLRDRPEFRLLLIDLAMPVEPFARSG
jgi:hypothetical protein